MRYYPTDIKHVAGRNSDTRYDGEIAEEDLWFLPGPMDNEPDHLSPLPRADADERPQITGWELAQGEQAAHLGPFLVRRFCQGVIGGLQPSHNGSQVLGLLAGAGQQAPHVFRSRLRRALPKAVRRQGVGSATSTSVLIFLKTAVNLN